MTRPARSPTVADAGNAVALLDLLPVWECQAHRNAQGRRVYLVAIEADGTRFEGAAHSFAGAAHAALSRYGARVTRGPLTLHAADGDQEPGTGPELFAESARDSCAPNFAMPTGPSRREKSNGSPGTAGSLD